MAITVMAAADTDATRTLIADMPDWIDRRRRMSDGYCTGRDDLPEVYGQMHSLPAEQGATCGECEQVVQPVTRGVHAPVVRDTSRDEAGARLFGDRAPPLVGGRTIDSEGSDRSLHALGFAEPIREVAGAERVRWRDRGHSGDDFDLGWVVFTNGHIGRLHQPVQQTGQREGRSVFQVGPDQLHTRRQALGGSPRRDGSGG